MDKQKIYQKIRDIAHRLEQNGGTYTRADLAFDLQELGISKDGFEVGMLVWEAYKNFRDDKAIRQAFYDNDGKRGLVDEYGVEHLVETQDDALFPYLHKQLDGGNDALRALEQRVTQAMNVQIAGGGSLLNTVVGTQGVVKVRNEATAVFNGYTQMVAGYDDAKQHIKTLMADFVRLRTYICDIYREYALTLTDTFGDSVKAVAPELFDFDSVQWLDLRDMLQRVQLDYDKVTERCALLMSDISDSFQESVRRAGASYRSGGSKQAGLVLAALNMVSHYTDAAQKTAALQQELLTLKNSVKRDVTLVKGDLSRLWVIHRTLDELYIPQAEAFSRFSRQVLSREWQQLTDALYADADVRKLKDSRDALLAACKALEKDVSDAELNISYYTSHLEECRALLDSLRPQYNQAKASKPQKPFFLANLFTFGGASRSYNRSLYEWNQACSPVVSRFEELQLDVKVDGDELNRQQAEHRENSRQLEEVRRQLHTLNRQLMDTIRVTPELRVKMLAHLEDIVRLLRLARSIANSRLDEKLTRTVTVREQDTALPPDLQQGIRLFANTVREQVNLGTDTMRQLVSEDGAEEARPTDEDLVQLTDAGNEAIRNTVSLLEEWGRLQAMKASSALAHREYDRELERLQTEFRARLAHIDDRSAVLRESLRRINTAQSPDELKAALLSLAGGDLKFTDDDWEQFLKGTKTIEL